MFNVHRGFQSKHTTQWPLETEPYISTSSSQQQRKIYFNDKIYNEKYFQIYSFHFFFYKWNIRFQLWHLEFNLHEIPNGLKVEIFVCFMAKITMKIESIIIEK